MKEKNFKTAIATIGCSAFAAGDCVSVEFHRRERGVNWFKIDKTQHGELESPIYYPGHHLREFVL